MRGRPCAGRGPARRGPPHRPRRRARSAAAARRPDRGRGDASSAAPAGTAPAARRFEPVPQPRSTTPTLSRPARKRPSAASEALVARPPVDGLAQGEPSGAEAHGATCPAPAPTFAAVSGQRGSASPAARAPSARRRRRPASAIARRSAAARAAASPGGTLRRGRVRHRLGGGAAGRGDERQAVGQGLGQNHAIALEHATARRTGRRHRRAAPGRPRRPCRQARCGLETGPRDGLAQEHGVRSDRGRGSRRSSPASRGREGPARAATSMS